MIGAVGGNSSSSVTAAQSAALTAAEQRQVAALKETDRKVRTHEQAHQSAGSGLVRGSSFTYQVGPDRQRYVVGGEVSIDVSPAQTPDQTITKAQQIRSAALAPADPSSQDRRIAALASQMEMQARSELSRQSDDQSKGESGQVNKAIAAYRRIAETMPGSTEFATQA